MSATSLPLRRLGAIIISATLALIAVNALSTLAGEKPVKREPNRAVKLIEDIGNRNKPPEVVKRRAGLPKHLALFPENYDWKEERRVRQAFDRLYREWTAEQWEELVRSRKDRRYCVLVVSVKTKDAHILSVGNICDFLASWYLRHPFEQHLPSDGIGRPIRLDVGIGNDLAAWRNARKDKSFVELQIEVCERALKALNKVEDEEERDKARKGIAAELGKLKKSKRPIFAETNGILYPFSQIEYNSKLAKKVREMIRTGSTEEILLDK